MTKIWRNIVCILDSKWQRLRQGLEKKKCECGNRRPPGSNFHLVPRESFPTYGLTRFFSLCRISVCICFLRREILIAPKAKPRPADETKSNLEEKKWGYEREPSSKQKSDKQSAAVLPFFSSAFAACSSSSCNARSCCSRWLNIIDGEF